MAVFSYLFSKIYRKGRRFFIAISGNPRPASFPYITGDGFRTLAKYIFDEISSFDPSAVEKSDIIFVQSGKIDEYFRNIHPLIKHPYKLITHNSDRNIGEEDLLYIDEKIIKWFSQNVSVRHPKLVPIPIGLGNLHLGYTGLPEVFSRLRKIPQNKKNKILVNFTLETNHDERSVAFKELSKNPQADILPPKLDYDSYVKVMRQYKYVASPPGNGLDCHRTWEALYLETVPIVKDSVAMKYFTSLNIPLQIIQDWGSLEKEMEYVESKAIFFDYWKDLIIKSDQ